MLAAEPSQRPGWAAVVAALGGVPEPAAEVVPSVSSFGVPVLTDEPAAPPVRPPAKSLADLVDDALAVNPSQWTPAEPLPVPSLAAVDGVSEHPLGLVQSLESLEGDAPLTPDEAFVPREYVPGQSGDAEYAAVPPALQELPPDELPADGPLKPAAEVKRSQLWPWVGLAVGLQVLALLLWVVYIKPFAGDPAPAPTPGKKAGK